MPRSDAIPLDAPAAPTGRAGAIPIDQPPAAAPAGQDLGTTAFWNKPTNVSWSDYMLAHLAKPAQQMDDLVRGATNTFGLGDRFAAGMNYLTGVGGDLAQQRATSAARAQADPLYGVGEMLGGAPVGELGVAKGLGGMIAPAGEGALAKIGQYGAGVLGSAAEGALTGGAAAVGRGEDIKQGMLFGGLTGLAGGLPGGVVGRGAKLPAAPSADDLKAAAQAAYKPLDSILYGDKEFGPALDALKAPQWNGVGPRPAPGAFDLQDLTGRQWKLAGSTRAEFDNLRAAPQLSATDIQKASARLGDIGDSIRATDQDLRFAPKVKAALDNFLANGTPQTGVPSNAPPGYAASVRAEGDRLGGMAKDVERLNDWVASSKVNRGSDVGSQASSWLQSDDGKTFAPPGSPAYDALNRLAGTSAPPPFSLIPSTFEMRHFAAPILGGLVGGAAGQAGEGHFDPAHFAEEAAVGALAGYGLHKGYQAVAYPIQAAAQKRALDAARATLATGQAQAPVYAAAPFRDAWRRLLMMTAAKGGVN